MKNRNVGRDRDFSATESTQKCRFTDTVLTNETVTTTISECEGSICQNAQATDRDIDVIQLNVLTLGLRVGAHLKRVDSHEELFVGHSLIRLVEQTGSFVGDILHGLLILLGADLALGLLKLLLVHLGLHLSSIGGFQVDCVSSQTQCRRHVPLRADIDGLFKFLGLEGHLPPLWVAIGGAQRGDEPRN